MTMLAVFAYFILVSFGLTLALVPVCRRMSFRLQILDHVAPRKHHLEDMPLLGGLAVYLAFSTVVLGHLLLAPALRDLSWVQAHVPPAVLWYVAGIEAVYSPVFGILTAGTAIVILGLWDDIWGLSARTRLLVQVLCALGVVQLGLRPRFFDVHPVFVHAVTVIWIVGITNSFNLLDGMDGLAAGVAAIAAGLLGTYMVLNAQPLVALLLFALVGVLAGFLRYNFWPARIYLGSSGSMFIGFLLAVSVPHAAFMTAGSHSVIPIVMPVLILGVPIYDTLSVIVIRLAKGLSPLSPDRNHLAHRLRRTGLSDKQTVLFIYLMTFCVGVNASLLGSATLFQSLVILIQILATFGMILILERVQLPEDAEGHHTLPVELQGRRADDFCVGIATKYAADMLDVVINRLPDDNLADLLAGGGLLAITVRPGGTRGDVRSSCRVLAVEKESERRYKLRLELSGLGSESRKVLESTMGRPEKPRAD